MTSNRPSFFRDGKATHTESPLAEANLLEAYGKPWLAIKVLHQALEDGLVSPETSLREVMAIKERNPHWEDDKKRFEKPIRDRNQIIGILGVALLLAIGFIGRVLHQW